MSNVRLLPEQDNAPAIMFNFASGWSVIFHIDDGKSQFTISDPSGEVLDTTGSAQLNAEQMADVIYWTSRMDKLQTVVDAWGQILHQSSRSP